MDGLVVKSLADDIHHTDEDIHHDCPPEPDVSLLVHPESLNGINLRSYFASLGKVVPRGIHVLLFHTD